MDEHTVRLLKQLRNDLRQTESLSENDLDLREHLLADIEALLQGSPEPTQEHPAIERLQEAIRRFEVSHPSLAEGMGRLIHSLTNIGI